MSMLDRREEGGWIDKMGKVSGRVRVHEGHLLGDIGGSPFVFRIHLMPRAWVRGI